MNKEKVSEALNGLDEAYITEAENTFARRPRYLAWAAAACLALVLGAGLMIGKAGRGPGSHTSELPHLEIIPADWASVPEVGKAEFDLPSGYLSDWRSANVYEALPLKPEASVLNRIAELLEIDAERIYIGGDGIFDADKNVSLEPAREQMYEDEEYLRIAREFLEAIGLPTEDYPLTKVYKNDFQYNGDSDDWDAFHLVEVQFSYRPIDGIEGPILGKRTTIVVGMSNEGEVVELYGGLWDFTKPKEYPLLTIEEAISRYLEDSDDTVIYSNCPAEGGTVTEVYLMYCLTETERDGERAYSLIPVYVFRGASGEGRFMIVTLALSKEHAKFLSFDWA